MQEIFFFVCFLHLAASRSLRTVDANALPALLDFMQAEFPPLASLSTDNDFCPRSISNTRQTDVACDGDGYITEMSFKSQVTASARIVLFCFDRFIPSAGLFCSIVSNVYATC